MGIDFKVKFPERCQQSTMVNRSTSSAAAVGLGAFIVGGAFAFALVRNRKPSSESIGRKGKTAVEQLIGNTPLIEIKSLSKLTGCTIMVTAPQS
jgi:hypothetical protein